MSRNKNRQIRLQLESIYGKGCMFQKAHIAQRIEEMGGIKTYKKYIQEHKYTLKKIKRLEETMTLHHIKHRSEGGATSVHNGAVMSALAQGYAHSLPREHEEIVNNMLRDYKFKALQMEVGDEVRVEGIEMEFDLSDCIEIELHSNPKKKPFNRAVEKRKTRELIEEEEEWEMI